MNQVSEAFKALFDDADAIVAEATKRAEVQVASNRADAARIREQLRALDKTCDAQIRLLEDPDIEELAKRAISRKLAETEARRTELQASLDRLAEAANMNTELLARNVRRVLAVAKESFANISTPAQFNEFVQAHVGQMTVGEDGALSPREPDLDETRAVQESIPASTPQEQPLSNGGFRPDFPDKDTILCIIEHRLIA